MHISHLICLISDFRTYYSCFCFCTHCYGC